MVFWLGISALIVTLISLFVDNVLIQMIIGLLIVIIACLFNVVSKLVAKVPYMDQLKESAQYVSDQEQKNNT